MMPLLVEITLKATVLLALGAVVAWSTRRYTSAATRHQLHLLSLVGALLLPLFVVALRPYQTPLSIPTVRAFPAPAVAASEAMPSQNTAVSEPDGLPASPIAATTPVSAAPLPTVPWTALLLAVYAMGVFVVLLRMAAGLFGLRRLVALCPVVADAEPLCSEAADALRTLGVRRTVTLRIATPDARDAMTTPMTWGLLRPTIALPNDARTWPTERVRAALLHEAAHIRRHDFLTRTVVARLAMALYWFHPLVWLAARQLRVESECACDDLVLTAGKMPGAAYAGHLLAVARTARCARSLSAAVTMAQSSHIEQRLRAILNTRRNRRETRGVARLATVVAAGIVGAASLLRLVGATAAGVESTGTETAITLPNGATVQLLGIETPTGADASGWWTRTGTRLAPAPADGANALKAVLKGDGWRTFAVAVHYKRQAEPTLTWAANPSQSAWWVRTGWYMPAKTDTFSFEPHPWVRIAGPHPEAEYSSGDTYRDDSDGQFVDTLLYSADLHAADRRADVQVNVTAGPWTDVLTCPFKVGRTDVPSRVDNIGGVHFGVDLHPRAWGGNAYVDAYDHFPANYDRRLVAVDREGRVLVDCSPFGMSPEGEPDDRWLGSPRYESRGLIPNALLPRVAALRLYLRPTQTAVFHGVPLEPTPLSAARPPANR